MGNKNLLTMIPVLKESITLRQNQDNKEIYQVCVPRTNLLERFSIKFLKQPTHHSIRLDQLGSFVIGMCDGQHPVEELEKKVADAFGQCASPVRERLLTFLSILEANGWIEWREP
jgi:hypothetical protein